MQRTQRYDSGRDPPPGLGTGRVRARKSLSCTPAVACVPRPPLDTCVVCCASAATGVLYSARTTDSSSSRLMLQFVRVIRDLASCLYCLVWTVVYGWPLFSVECGVWSFDCSLRSSQENCWSFSGANHCIRTRGSAFYIGVDGPRSGAGWYTT